MDAGDLAIVRRAFAKQILAEVQIDDPALEAALAATPREAYLGPGPWVIPRWAAGYVPTPSADPVYLYVDAVVQIVGERFINNGQPSGHAKWMHAAGVRPGDHVVHVGTGTGYFTAILAHLTGPTGKVTGIEIDPDLAARSRANLSGFRHVTVLAADGAAAPFEPADVIYVNAGATHPAASWLDGLRDGGRLILPLTTDQGFRNRDPTVPLSRSGAMYRIERRGVTHLARWISPVAIIPCENARNAAAEKALAEAFQAGGWDKVTHLQRTATPTGWCWLRGDGWALTGTG